jgi:hypothetical protein
MDAISAFLKSVIQYIVANWSMLIALAAIAACTAVWQRNVHRDKNTLAEIARLKDEIGESGKTSLPPSAWRLIERLASQELPPGELIHSLRSFLLPEARTRAFPLSSEDAAAYESALASIDQKLPVDPFFLHFERTLISTTLFVGAIVIANGLAQTYAEPAWSQAISDVSTLVLTAVYIISWSVGYRRNPT